MTKLLTEVLQKVAELPEERQDDAAHVLLSMIESDTRPYRITDVQLGEVEEAIADVDAGHFASQKNIEEILHHPWA